VTLGTLFTFFVKAGALTFGHGLVIVPSLEKGLVQHTGWLNEREFLVAVAMGMISPGPVVITATFVGYLVASFWGEPTWVFVKYGACPSPGTSGSSRDGSSTAAGPPPPRWP
jgi:chromate transport protein ChrA